MPQARRNRNARRTPSRGQVRIIGGEWRGRKASFPDAQGLRPTPDRVRETLFNWLAPHIAGARCLDLFAGSGALGLEALSRGAETCTFIDRQRDVTQALAANLEHFRCSAQRAPIITADALTRLEQPPERPFDIVFLDPPFGQGLIPACLALIDSGRWLSPGGWLYLEQAAADPPPPAPSHWLLHREKVSGEVSYRLYRHDMGAGSRDPGAEAEAGSHEPAAPGSRLQAPDPQVSQRALNAYDSHTLDANQNMEP